jgi:hypothetical protein
MSVRAETLRVLSPAGCGPPPTVAETAAAVAARAEAAAIVPSDSAGEGDETVCWRGGIFCSFFLYSFCTFSKFWSFFRVCIGREEQ